MKQLLLILFALLTICSCHEVIEREGDWTPMKWVKTDYRVVKEGNTDYVYVPSEGGTYIFRCTNYSDFLLGDAFFEADGRQWHSYEEWVNNPDYEQDWHHYANDWIDVTVKEGGDLEVVFQPNTSGSVRKASVSVTAGNISYSFHFMQSMSF